MAKAECIGSCPVWLVDATAPDGVLLPCPPAARILFPSHDQGQEFQ